MANIVGVEGVDEVISNLHKWEQEKRNGLARVVAQEVVPMLQNYAQSNRPWTDRTGDARDGLRASHEMTATEVVLYLSHTVEYGVFLELCQAGKYAILLPTFERTRGDIERILQRFWGE